MSDENDSFFGNSKPLAKRKFVPKKISHKAKLARIEQKYLLVLVFLDGEVWSTVKILSHVLKIGERQTQKTLADMVKAKLLKVEIVNANLRLYGITATGLATINDDSDCKPFQIGKTPLSTIDHHLYSQNIRILLQRHGATNWTPGKSLYKLDYFTKIPDGAFTYTKTTGSNIGIEVIGITEAELHVKSRKRMKSVINDHLSDLGPPGDAVARLQMILYFSPYPAAIQKFINEFVPTELQKHFLVMHLDKDIQPFFHNLLYFDDYEISKFLDRNS